MVGGVEMKKIFFSLLLASSFSLFAKTEPLDPDPQVDAVLRVLQVLNAWADQYPQCYQAVSDIKEMISSLRQYAMDRNDELSRFHSAFTTSASDIKDMIAALRSYAMERNDELSRFHSSFSTYAQDFSSYQSLFYSASEEIKYLLSDISSNVLQLSLDLNSQNDFLLPALNEIVAILEKLPDFGSWTPNVHVSNYIDLKDVFRDLFNEIIVNCHLDADPSFNVNLNFDFNYDYFLPIKQFNEKANRPYFSLNTFTRYHPRTWLFNEKDSMDSLVSPIDSSTVGVDFLDFLCSCGNALVAQNQDISMLLCQLLGCFKQSHEDFDELKQLATSSADGASQDLDSLKSAFHASSLEDVAAQYFVDLSIDDKFDSDFLGFGHGSGASCPEFIDIGPIPFSRIHSSMTDYTLHFSTAGLKSFFDICRQCFTVVWYLFFLTICIFLARFGWAFLKPILRALTSVLNW